MYIGFIMLVLFHLKNRSVTVTIRKTALIIPSQVLRSLRSRETLTRNKRFNEFSRGGDLRVLAMIWCGGLRYCRGGGLQGYVTGTVITTKAECRAQLRGLYPTLDINYC